MELVIDQKQLGAWLDYLKERFQLVDTREDILPVKKYFLPPHEEVFSYDLKNRQLRVLGGNKKNLLIFGLALPDLEAMTQLDEIMKRPNADFFYWQKRKKSVIVGLVEHSVKVVPGGDLILEKINPRQYRLLVLTKKGEKVPLGKFFRKTARPKTKDSFIRDSSLREMLLDSELLAEAVAWSWGQPIWDDLAKICLGCGICTYVCPLCYCFSVEDRVNLENDECKRCRHWTACTLPEFAEIAGDHNFHPLIKERYYNWFYHKFVRAYKEYGKSQCVGCGRCQKYCPAGIDIEKVLLEILKSYREVRASGF